MNIAILGAGGVGGYYGGLLARGGHDVRVLARGAHLSAIRDRGLAVKTPEESWTARVTVADDVEALGDVDVAILAVKSYSLDELAPAARRLAERGATVLPLLNGVDVNERLQRHGVARDQLLGGLTYVSAARTAPGTIERFTPFQRVLVGELDGGTSTRAERIAAALREVGADAAAHERIDVAIWQKFVYIATVAAACGLVRASIGVVRERPLGRRLLDRAAEEVVAVGRSRGVALPAGEAATAVGRMMELPPGMKPSFLLDLEAGGPTELDALSGAVSRMGAACGVPTPVHDTAVAVLSPDATGRGATGGEATPR